MTSTVPLTSRSPAHASAAAALTVVLDLAAPIFVFYALRWAGAGVFVALIAGAITPTLNVLVTLAKDRRVDALAVAVLGVLLLSAGTAALKVRARRRRSRTWSTVGRLDARPRNEVDPSARLLLRATYDNQVPHEDRPTDPEAWAPRRPVIVRPAEPITELAVTCVAD